MFYIYCFHSTFRVQQIARTVISLHATCIKWVFARTKLRAQKIIKTSLKATLRSETISDNWKPFNSLSTNPTKWSNTLKQFVDKLPTKCLSVFDHFVKLPLKGLKCFLFHVKSSFRSWDNYNFVLTFWLCRNTAW